MGDFKDGIDLQGLWETFHLAAVVLLPYKLHASRSATGVSLKMQELYLLVYLTRMTMESGLPFADWSWDEGAMPLFKTALTATTIGMMRCRPSLRASYDASLDNFRSWAHGIFPAFMLTIAVWEMECSGGEVSCLFVDHFNLPIFLWVFSQVLEPFAIVPQLLVFRGCTDAGRLTAVYVSLMAAYRAIFFLNGVMTLFDREETKGSGSNGSGSTTTSATGITGFLLLEIVISIFQTVTLVVFLADWRLRVSRRSPPEETGDMMQPNSAARQRLLPDQDRTDDYSGDGASASRFGIFGGGCGGGGGDGGGGGGGGGGGCAGGALASGLPSRRQEQRVEIVDRIESVLLRERDQERPSSSNSTAATATTTSSEGRMRGDSGEAFLVGDTRKAETRWFRGLADKARS